MRFIKKNRFLISQIRAYVLVIFLLIASCIKKKDYPQCVGFNDLKFTLWFPYHINQSLYFQSSLSPTIIDTFKISVVDKSNPFQKNAFSSGDSCSSSIKIQAPKERNGFNLSVNYLKNQYYRGETYNSMTLSIVNSGWRFDGINEAGLILEDKPNIEVKSAYFKDLTLNGINFKEVQQIEKDTIKVPIGAVYKIWLAKNKGLIAFKYNGTNEIWRLIN